MSGKIRGFTLIETVMALAIMGLIIVSVLGVFVKGNQAIKKSQHQTTGITIAQKKLSETKSLLSLYPMADDNIKAYISSSITGDINDIQPAGAVIVWPSSSPIVPVTIKGTEVLSINDKYDFEIYIEDYVSTITHTSMKDLKQVTVKVDWLDPVTGRMMITKMSTLITKPIF